MLDDQNIITQHDPRDALGIAASEIEQLTAPVELENSIPEGFTPENVIVAGMGGSALAAEIADVWMHLPVPLEVVRGYELPSYANGKTLVIGSSFSGNTEETLSALENAKMRGCEVAVVAAGGRLVEMARSEAAPMVLLPSEVEARMAVLHNLRALAKLLESFGLVKDACDELAANAEWLAKEVTSWKPEVPTVENYAKQLALEAVGKTAVIYGGALTAPAAYKWKMAFNENAKNLAFWNVLPEFNHNEFIGWTSHPVEKPYVVFDLVSSFEHKQILRRFEVSDRLLSGSRPKAQTVTLKGENLIGQLAWASILGDFVSVYLAIVNGVDPSSIERVDKLKKELSS